MRGQDVSDAEIREKRFISNTRGREISESREESKCETDSPRGESADFPRAVFEPHSIERHSTVVSTRMLEDDQKTSKGETNDWNSKSSRVKLLGKDEFSIKLNDLMIAQGFSEAQVRMVSGTPHH